MIIIIRRTTAHRTLEEEEEEEKRKTVIVIAEPLREYDNCGVWKTSSTTTSQRQEKACFYQECQQ